MGLLEWTEVLHTSNRWVQSPHCLPFIFGSTKVDEMLPQVVKLGTGINLIICAYDVMNSMKLF